jgi:hypothetical protein
MGLVPVDTDSSNQEEDDDCSCLGPHELVFDGNRFTIGSSGEGHAVVRLASGLARNTTLRLLSLRGSYHYDRTLEQLIQSLIGHPILEVLQVAFSDFGPATISSVQRLLSSPHCQLQELELSNIVSLSDTSTRIFDIQTFILRMPVNRSLQTLILTKQELTDLDVNFLLQSLRTTLPSISNSIEFEIWQC